MPTERITKALVGELFRGFEVLASCATNKGLWVCVTHDLDFANQFEKDCHIHRGTHRLVWLCFEHGAEQP